jgi:hypothetical protein
LVLTHEWYLIRPSLSYYIEDDRPLIIFDSNDHIDKKINALAKRGYLGSNLKIAKIA